MTEPVASDTSINYVITIDKRKVKHFDFSQLAEYERYRNQCHFSFYFTMSFLRFFVVTYPHIQLYNNKKNGIHIVPQNREN